MGTTEIRTTTAGQEERQGEPGSTVGEQARPTGPAEPPPDSNTGQSALCSLVMNGGGVKGLAFVGALRELHERVDIRIDRFGGTSAGAIGAAILAMGYSVEVMEEVIRRQSFVDFLDADWKPPLSEKPWARAPQKRRGTLAAFGSLFMGVVKLPFGLFSIVVPVWRGALYSSAPVGRFIYYLAKWRPYQDDHNRGQLRIMPDADLSMKIEDMQYGAGLMVIAASTGQENTYTFLPNEDIEHAVRASMAIPLVFTPQEHNGGRDVLYDGGLVANFAFEQFRRQNPDRRPIGLYLYDGLNVNRAGDATMSVWSVLLHVFRVFMGQDEAKILRAYKKEIIRIDTSPIGTIDFKLSDEDKDLLVLAGRVGVVRHLWEDNPGLPYRENGKPAKGEFAAIVDRWNLAKEAAIKRHRWPHRFRLWRIIASVCTICAVLALAGYGVVVGVEAGSRRLLNAWHRDSSPRPRPTIGVPRPTPPAEPLRALPSAATVHPPASAPNERRQPLTAMPGPPPHPASRPVRAPGHSSVEIIIPRPAE